MTRLLFSLGHGLSSRSRAAGRLVVLAVGATLLFLLHESIGVDRTWIRQTKNVSNTKKLHHNNVLFSGALNVHPTHLEGKCAAVRFRGSNETLTVDEAIAYLQQQNENDALTVLSSLSVGLEFVDWPDKFLSLGNDVFHLYHFCEFLVIAYQVLHRLPINELHVPWLYAPLLSEREVCGTNFINCWIAELLFRYTHTASNGEIQTHKTRIYGLESNDNFTLQLHPAFTGHHPKRERSWQPPILSRPWDDRGVDAVLLISRGECDHKDYNKMAAAYERDFPAQAWHADVIQGLQVAKRRHDMTTTNQTFVRHHNTSKNRNKMIVCYIDRQGTHRTMPVTEHQWLVDILTDHPLMDFWHLNMEEYTALEQIDLATRCDVLLGVHGNGLSHSLWMKPGRFVVEIFYKFRYQFDYALLATLMNHEYLAVYNFEVLNATRVAARDPFLRDLPTELDFGQENIKHLVDQLLSSRRAITDFLQHALFELGYR